MVKMYIRPAKLSIVAITLLIFYGIVMGICGNAFGQAGWELRPRDPNLKGKIESPSGPQVKRHFSVQGTVTAGNPRNLWLIERIGQQQFPKEPKLVVREGRWEGEVFEGGWPPAGKFEILLVEVSDTLSKKFDEWLQMGHRTGHYPGIPAKDLKEMIILDRKEYNLEAEGKQ